MQDFTQDRLIQSEKLTEFNIAYPIYISEWEVRQVQDMNKLYARVFYRKLEVNSKAAKVKITCISEFGETIQEEIKSINDIDKKTYDFFEIYPVHPDTRMLQVQVVQGLCTDGTSVSDAQPVIAADTFAAFDREIVRAAAQRLVPSAVGYPQKGDACWICCCGALNKNTSEYCISCAAAKRNVFETITEEHVNEQIGIVTAEHTAKKEQEDRERAAQELKRKKRNKLIAILSACCAAAIILFCSLFFPLAPLNKVTQDGFVFEKLYGGYYYHLVDYMGDETEIEIPSTVRGVEVKYIGPDAFRRNTEIKSITLPDSIIYIDNHAFEGCRNLENVHMGNNVMSIRYSAFYGCESLRSITIPGSVTSIGDEAFSDCTGLTSITIGNSVTSIGDYAFSDCTGLTEIYYDAEEVADLTYSSDVFYNAGTSGDGITVIFGDTVKSIPAYLFDVSDSSYQPKITSVTIGNNVTSIGDWAFRGYTGLTSVTIGNNVTSIGDWAFRGCTGLTSVTIGNSVTSIGERAFYNCSGLTSVTIPNSVTSIGDSAFEWCTRLTSIAIGNSVTSIGDSAFSLCSGLTSITIGNSVTSIGDWAFRDCTRLTSVTIGNSVASIGAWAFRGCTGLTKIYYNAEEVADLTYSVFSYSNNVFYNAGTSGDGITVIFGDTVKSIPASLFHVSDPSYQPKITSVTIGNNVTSIGSSAFRDCTRLTSVTIGVGVTWIGEDAFKNCSALTSITMPSSLDHMSRNVFSGCFGLTQVKFENPNGWECSRNSWKKSITSTALSDPATAATYLTSTYCDYSWNRS